MTRLIVSLALASISLNVHAARPASPQVSEGSDDRIVASRVVLMNAGQPVCRASLAEMPTLKPKFIRLGPDAGGVDQGPSGSLRACAGHELTDLQNTAGLLSARNQVAAFPLIAVPVAVCLAGSALGAWGGHQARQLMMTDGGSFYWSLWGVSGGAQALAMMTTGVLNAPATYAAAYGGLIGATCGFVGTAASMMYFQYKK